MDFYFVIFKENSLVFLVLFVTSIFKVTLIQNLDTLLNN